MLDLSHMIQDMTKDINTKASEFKIIEDSKDEPSLKEAQEFVGGYVEGINFPNGDYLIVNEEGKLNILPSSLSSNKSPFGNCTHSTMPPTNFETSL